MFIQCLQLPYQQLIIRRSHLKTRSFITHTPEQRKQIADHKFYYEDQKIQGKHLILIDDSIVRGNIMESILTNCNRCGAASIHLRIPSPPVVDICQLGISIRSRQELLVSKGDTMKQIQEKLGCDSLQYLSLQEIKLLYPYYNFYAECFGKDLPPKIQRFLSKRI